MSRFFILMDENGRRKRKFRIVSPKKKNKKSSKEEERTKTSILSSEKYCPCCHVTVANGDPDGEDVPGSNGEKRQHRFCVRRLAVARCRDTELREVAN
jgi:hypothetical protein